MLQATEETSNLGKTYSVSPSPTPWAQSWNSTAPQTPSPGNFASSDRHRSAGSLHQGLPPPPPPYPCPRPWRPEQHPARAQGPCRQNGHLGKTPGRAIREGRLAGRRPLQHPSPVSLPNLGLALPWEFSRGQHFVTLPSKHVPQILSTPCALGGLGLRNIPGLSSEPHPLLPAHPFGGVK